MSLKDFKIIVYTDGCCMENPGGKGGAAAIVELPEQKRAFELSHGYDSTTNNRMELRAVIIALEFIQQNCFRGPVIIYSDSKYVVNAFELNWVRNWAKKGWKDKGVLRKNHDLFKRIIQLKERLSVKFEWVKGHNGHRQNERCDVLAYDAAHKPLLAPDDIVSSPQRPMNLEAIKPLTDIKIKVRYEGNTGEYCSSILRNNEVVSVLTERFVGLSRKEVHLNAFINSLKEVPDNHYPVTVKTSSPFMKKFFSHEPVSGPFQLMSQLKLMTQGKKIEVKQYKEKV